MTGRTGSRRPWPARRTPSIIDLEDAVAAAAKDDARRNALAALDDAARPRVVRINAPGTPAGRGRHRRARRARRPRASGCPSARTRASCAASPTRSACRCTRCSNRRWAWRTRLAIATAHPLVAGISLGEADLAADLRVAGGDALTWPRSRVVVAARAAGLPSPVQSVWTAVRDLDGLRASTEAGPRDAGFFGRSVIHPAQIPVVHEAFAPDPAETAWASELLDAARSADESAAWIDHNGQFVDAAIVARARWVLAHAESAEKEGQHS